MRNKIKYLLFLILALSLTYNFQTEAYSPSDVNFHESIQIGETFHWEFTKYIASDVHYPDLSTEYKKGDIIRAEIVAEPVFSISASLIPQPIKEDGWIEYSLNETIIDISTGVFTTMGVYPFSFFYPLSYYDSAEDLQDYFTEYFDYFNQYFVSQSTRDNDYWQKLSDDFYENRYTRRDEDGRGYVYLKIHLATGFLSQVEVERHSSDNEYDVHYMLESVEYRAVKFNFLVTGFSLLLLTTVMLALRKRK
ncbi:MAG: hypothetical protein HGN29_03120 [Asgard group archaeon]|nr:hypothetical protein [Asgard group archaeon]